MTSFPAVKYGSLHYRHLDWDKTQALKDHSGNFDAPVSLSEAAKGELEWWVTNVPNVSNDIAPSDPDITVYSDASLLGWGSECEGVRTGGTWLPEEKSNHINFLELQAAFFTLQSFREKVEHRHVRLMMDNTTAVACINKGTSRSREIMALLREIFWLTELNNIRLSCHYFPGQWNSLADAVSHLHEPGSLEKINHNLLHVTSLFKILWPFFFIQHLSNKTFISVVAHPAVIASSTSQKRR